MKKIRVGAVTAGTAYGPRPVTVTRRPAHQLSAARASVLELLTNQPRPCTVAALATMIGQHPNTIREHLDGLVASGLAKRTRADSIGRGRPAWLYAATDEDGGTPGAREYAGLATALAGQLARTSTDPAGDAIEAGKAWGRALARDREPAENPTAARRDVVEILDDLGFDPDADARAEVVRLRRCPLLEAAYEHPDIVCGVHVGIVRGALETLGGDSEAAEMLPFAEPGCCRLDLGRAAAHPLR